jgi:hypothetical protein
VATSWLTSNGAVGALALGNWEEATELLDEYERITGTEGHYLDAQSAGVHALMAFARGEPAALERLTAPCLPS